MERSDASKYFFFALLIALLYLSFRMINPFLKYITMGLILTYVLHPLYRKLQSYVRNESLASGLMILFILIMLIIPSSYVITSLITQTSSAVATLKDIQLAENKYAQQLGLEETQLREISQEVLNRGGDFIISTASNMLGSMPQLVIGLFVMFFVIYYGFKQGPQLFHTVKEHIPLDDTTKDKLIDEVHSVSHGVLYGWVLTGIIQGTIGGLGFLIFGLPNPIFWGFIMILFSSLPLVGTPVIWGPAVIIQLVTGDYASAIGLFIYSSVLTLNIDNVLRPKLISEHAQIHPIIVLVGVLGGLGIFGFAGIILGPLVLALLISMLHFYTSEELFMQAE